MNPVASLICTILLEIASMERLTIKERMTSGRNQYIAKSREERKRMKKLINEVEGEIKNMKVKYATGKIDEDIYEVAIREMQNRKDVLTLELEKCNDNLSNPKPQQVL